MKLPIHDISAENMQMKAGQNKPADIERHADGWLKAHAKLVDNWLSEAKSAAK